MKYAINVINNPEEALSILNISITELNNLPPEQIAEIIKRKYRMLAFQHHPDRHPPEYGDQSFIQVNSAYEFLKNGNWNIGPVDSSMLTSFLTEENDENLINTHFNPTPLRPLKWNDETQTYEQTTGNEEWETYKQNYKPPMTELVPEDKIFIFDVNGKQYNTPAQLDTQTETLTFHTNGISNSATLFLLDKYEQKKLGDIQTSLPLMLKKLSETTNSIEPNVLFPGSRYMSAEELWWAKMTASTMSRWPKMLGRIDRNKIIFTNANFKNGIREGIALVLILGEIEQILQIDS